MPRAPYTHVVVGGEHRGRKCRVLTRETRRRPSPPGRGKTWIEFTDGTCALISTSQIRRRY